MNRETAKFWAKAITELLTDRKLIRVSVTPSGVDVRQNQTFRNAYAARYENGSYYIVLGDSYGILSGATDWRIDPAQRSITAKTVNGYGELCQFVWAICDDGESSEIYHLMADAQKKSWGFPYEAVNKPE